MEPQAKRKRLVEVKKYTLKQLADIYCTTKYLLSNEIKKHEQEIGKREGYYYNAQQVDIMFKRIRLPSSVEVL